MIEIIYQAAGAGSDAVTGTVSVPEVVDLGHAHRLAVADAGEAHVDVIAVHLPDGRDLVAEHEGHWAAEL